MKKSLLVCLILLLAVSLFSGCAQTAAPGSGASATKLTADLPAEPAADTRVFYEIFVGSFYDSDGDGMGDLNGVLQKLDYLNDGDPSSDSSLHVGGIWLMPISPSPTYHKYDVTDYYAVAPQYGTLADFEALAAACKERGIALILDLVVNHTSSEHPWFRAACSSLAVQSCTGSRVCTDQAPCPLHNRYYGYYRFSNKSASGFAPAGIPGVQAFYEARFWSGMPDLNLDNPDVRDEIRAIMGFWLEKGATGFRLDATTSYYTGNMTQNTDFLAWITQTARELDPQVYLVGEAWSDENTVLSMYRSGIDSLFNFPFSQYDGAVASAVRTGNGAEFAEKLATWRQKLLAANPDAIDAPFLTNHDNARSAGALLRDPILEKQAAALYLLMPGNPFIYYGEEIAMAGGTARDEEKRAPLIWSLADPAGQTLPPVGAQTIEPVAAGVAEQLADPHSLLRYYIGIVRIRNAIPALAAGTVTPLDTGQPAVCAYTCAGGESAATVVHNLGADRLVIEVGAEMELLAAFNAGGTELPKLQSGSLTLPPRSGAVLG